MDNLHRNYLSRKYANAYLNIHLDDMSNEVIKQLGAASVFFSQKKEGLYFIHLANVDDAIKLKAIMNVMQKFDLNKLTSLCSLLIEDRRVFLLSRVLHYIRKLYLERMNIMEFDITSTVNLNEKQRAIIENFLEKNTRKKIKAQYSIDPSLIAGLRLQSDQYKWEVSVYQELTRLRTVNI